MSYRQMCDRERFSGGPALRGLSGVFVPQLLGTPEGGVLNKVVIFAPLPGQASYVNWFLRTFHAGIHSILYHAGVASRDRDRLLQEFASVDRPAALILTPALGGTGLNLVAANHVIILQKFWNLKEQRQAVARIHCIGQRRTPKAWILRCERGVDDRAEELYQSRGKFEARVMHGLTGQKFSYMELMDTRATRIHAREAQSATQASAAVPGPSGTQDGDDDAPGSSGTQGGDDDAPGSSGTQGSDDGTPSPPQVRVTGCGYPDPPPPTYRY